MPLGDYLCSLEKDLSDIMGAQYFTVRLDGKNFSSVYQQLQQLGLFSSGYSLEYETIMQAVCHKLTNYFANVLYAYTQSDEITLLFVSAPFNETTQTHGPHLFSGRHDKIISLAASLATQYFCKQLIQLHYKVAKTKTVSISAAKEKDEVDGESDECFDGLPIATFDARIAKFSFLSDAFQMILWRSYDCSVNSVSTALRLLKLNTDIHNLSKNEINGLSTLNKVLLLHQANLLAEMTEHQKYGTLYYHGRDDPALPSTGQKKSKRRKICTQLITGQTIVNVKEGTIIFAPEIVRCSASSAAALPYAMETTYAK
jgi:tRNA(His) 5'-end guanylyltransferase